MVAIFGSTNPATTGPLGEWAVVVRKEVDCAPCLLRECPTDHICMESITADDVVDAAVSLLNRFDAIEIGDNNQDDR